MVVHESRTHFAFPIMHVYSVCVFVLINSSACESSNIIEINLKSQELNVKYEAKHWGLQEYLRICEYNVSVSLFWVGVWVLCCCVEPPGGRVLQGVVVAILGFAELVKEKDDCLKAKD